MGLKTEVDRLYHAIVGGPAIVLTRWPIGATGTLLTAGGVAWTLAAAGAGQVQLVAAAQNTRGMWIAGVGIQTPSAAGQFVVWVGRGTIATAVLAAQAEFACTAHTFAGAAAGSVTILQPTPATIFFPIWVFVRAGVGIALDITSSNAAADTARAHLIIATGL